MVGGTPVVVILFGMLYWLTLVLLALLVRGRTHFTITNW